MVILYQYGKKLNIEIHNIFYIIELSNSKNLNVFIEKFMKRFI
jgi:hypothetical protein